MVKVYKNGKEFLEENKAYLDTNKYMAVFFYLDAEVLHEATPKNYAIKIEDENKKLLAIKVEPYNVCLFGDKECLRELLEFLRDNGYFYQGFLCPSEVGDHLLDTIESITGKKGKEDIGMDFMESLVYTSPSSSEVEVAQMSDVDTIYNYTLSFLLDCGLPDKPKKEAIKAKINSFRIIRKDGIIVSMASFSRATEESYRITHVYTLPSYRGHGYAKIVVNNIKNEILDMGYIPTLNVDKKNPISNHIYASLGFKKVFSQGVYSIIEK